MGKYIMGIYLNLLEQSTVEMTHIICPVHWFSSMAKHMLTCMVLWPLSPVTMWPTFFNQEYQNLLKLSRVLGYVLNLTIGKSGPAIQTSTQKVQDEHDCPNHIFDQVKTIHNNGGIRTHVMGWQVTIKILIHLITGDTSGHNDLCGYITAIRLVDLCLVIQGI